MKMKWNDPAAIREMEDLAKAQPPNADDAEVQTIMTELRRGAESGDLQARAACKVMLAVLPLVGKSAKFAHAGDGSSAVDILIGLADGLGAAAGAMLKAVAEDDLQRLVLDRIEAAQIAAMGGTVEQ
jgi:hypothetical protein